MKKGALGCLGLFAVLMVIGLIKTASETPEERAAREKARQERAVAEHKATLEKQAALPPPAAAPRETTPAVEPFELLDAKASYDEYRFDVAGKIKNSTAKKYNYAQVTFSVYDSSGAKVGSALANINNLAPGETWAFKALCMCPTGRRYKFDGVTGF